MEIIKDQLMFGLRCKDTQAKILALGKGLPTLEAVITKAEVEEQAQDQLIELRGSNTRTEQRCRGLRSTRPS